MSLSVLQVNIIYFLWSYTLPLLVYWSFLVTLQTEETSLHCFAFVLYPLPAL